MSLGKNIRSFILRFRTGGNYDHGDRVKKYLAVERSSHPYGDWGAHYVIQFDTKKEWNDWKREHIAKSEKRFWILYECIEKEAKS